jgi:hypothetical protein
VKYTACEVADLVEAHFTCGVTAQAPLAASSAPVTTGAPSLGAGDPEPSMLMAAAVPKIAGIAQEVLKASRGVAEDVSKLPSVQALLDATYARGPFLDYSMD